MSVKSILMAEVTGSSSSLMSSFNVW